ncbi:Uma2 family endonuclease [Desmonostoc muscorum LEGE 12446]|uniref:Uma2 family endonuclease n=1 Tax=Desmonostoc muscorum LEGE 12446 TaxID=1828758 RepID=A0A8J7DDA1_DESMC|nr:Uma2 family endonuclease [Desmonostoc muscorum]MCF2146000.1 Uma2 family endonuclease [Desmonostoc muscorum LEGE 12446]
MVQQVTPETNIEVIYPESDGQPMADNTEQFAWIVKIKENLEILFASQADVFIAGDLFWYPVKGNSNIKQAPDTMVVFGRPKGKRSSYLQWDEDNIPPQVVFEILSPGNTLKEMTKKLQFYQRYGVEEYYIYDPDKNDLNGLLRSGDSFEVIEEMNDWVSPRLKIRFHLTSNTLEIVSLTGQKFLSPVEIDQLREQERQRAEQERQRAEQETQAKEAALQELEKERDRYQELLAKLKEKGIDTDNL